MAGTGTASDRHDWRPTLGLDIFGDFERTEATVFGTRTEAASRYSRSRRCERATLHPVSGLAVSSLRMVVGVARLLARAAPITFPAAVMGVAMALAAAACSGTSPMGVATADRPFGLRTKDSGCQVHDGLADAACTPGAIFPDVTLDQVCRPGFSASVRDVPAALSREVYREYGILERTTGEYEVDHLVPLEAGGSNDIANLFPEAAEPRPGFHEKDQVENYVHDQVCSGAMSLLDGQRAIATNWVDLYQRLPRRGVATAVVPLATAPQPDAGSTVQIVSVAGTRPGGQATVVAHAPPGATCGITYRTPAGTVSTAQGLTSRTTDADGTVTWTWEIGPSTQPGTGSVVVTCDGASVRSPIQIG
jgi:hypothetical protein